MSKKNQTAKATLAAVTREMAKPRVAKSAREHPYFRNEALFVENNIDKGTMDFHPTVATNETQFPRAPQS
ncbi:MAG TPA: hypothetical protein VN682_17815 [Terriglobales bacterium]|nr:hypothetical protein [Terriglobales bacterium]HXF14783.1 hypothetical protein [Terriglobales bacterium]